MNAFVVKVADDKWAACCPCGWRGEPVGCRSCAETDKFNHECTRAACNEHATFASTRTE